MLAVMDTLSICCMCSGFAALYSSGVTKVLHAVRKVALRRHKFQGQLDSDVTLFLGMVAHEGALSTAWLLIFAGGNAPDSAWCN